MVVTCARQLRRAEELPGRSLHGRTHAHEPPEYIRDPDALVDFYLQLSLESKLDL
jgi:hypothetical protein